MLQTNSKDKTTNADLLQQIEALKAENAKLKAREAAKVSFKISEKGCLSCMGSQDSRSHFTPANGGR